MPDRLGEGVDHLVDGEGADVVFHADVLGDLLGRFDVRRPLHAHRERPHVGFVPLGDGGDDARVEAPGEEGANLDVRHEPLLHRVVDEVSNDLRVGHAAVRGHEVILLGTVLGEAETGRQQAHRLGVDASLDQRLGLRREVPAPPVPRIVERLDPDGIARGEEAATLLIVEHEGEHAVEQPNAVVAVVLVEVGDDLRVGRGQQLVIGNEVRGDRLVVVDLAVADHVNVARLVAQRLLPTFEIDDAQSVDADPAEPIEELVPGAVFTAVDRAREHRFQHVLVRHVEHPHDPAHGRCLSNKPFELKWFALTGQGAASQFGLERLECARR